MRRSVTPTLIFLACRKWTLVVSRRRSRKNVALGAISGVKVGHRPKLDPDGCWEKTHRERVEEVVWRAAAAAGEESAARSTFFFFFRSKLKPLARCCRVSRPTTVGIQQRPLFSRGMHLILYILYVQKAHTHE